MPCKLVVEEEQEVCQEEWEVKRWNRRLANGKAPEILLYQDEL
jgi:hypothetical protein